MKIIAIFYYNHAINIYSSNINVLNLSKMETVHISASNGFMNHFLRKK